MRTATEHNIDSQRTNLTFTPSAFRRPIPPADLQANATQLREAESPHKATRHILGMRVRLQRRFNLETPRLKKRFGNEFRVFVVTCPLAKAS